MRLSHPESPVAPRRAGPGRHPLPDGRRVHAVLAGLCLGGLGCHAAAPAPTATPSSSSTAAAGPGANPARGDADGVGDCAPRAPADLRERAQEGMRFVYRIEAQGAEPHLREVELLEVTDDAFRSRTIYRTVDGAPLGAPIEGGLTWEEASHLSLFPHGHETSWEAVHRTPEGERFPCRMYQSEDEHGGDPVVTRACFTPTMPVPVSHEVRRGGTTLQRMVLIGHAAGRPPADPAAAADTPD